MGTFAKVVGWIVSIPALLIGLVFLFGAARGNVYLPVAGAACIAFAFFANPLSRRIARPLRSPAITIVALLTTIGVGAAGLYLSVQQTSTTASQPSASGLSPYLEAGRRAMEKISRESEARDAKLDDATTGIIRFVLAYETNKPVDAGGAADALSRVKAIPDSVTEDDRYECMMAMAKAKASDETHDKYGVPLSGVIQLWDERPAANENGADATMKGLKKYKAPSTSALRLYYAEWYGAYYRTLASKYGEEKAGGIIQARADAEQQALKNPGAADEVLMRRMFGERKCYDLVGAELAPA